MQQWLLQRQWQLSRCRGAAVGGGQHHQQLSTAAPPQTHWGPSCRAAPGPARPPPSCTSHHRCECHSALADGFQGPVNAPASPHPRQGTPAAGQLQRVAALPHSAPLIWQCTMGNSTRHEASGTCRQRTMASCEGSLKPATMAAISSGVTSGKEASCQCVGTVAVSKLLHAQTRGVRWMAVVVHSSHGCCPPAPKCRRPGPRSPRAPAGRRCRTQFGEGQLHNSKQWQHLDM